MRRPTSACARPESPAVGLDITIYNPTFDDDERTAARTLASAVTLAFARASGIENKFYSIDEEE